MKEIIEDIRRKLKDGSYKNEQHIRISLVARICQVLGWNIWDPVEFNTEFKVNKLVTDMKKTTGKGSVDVALFKEPRKKNEKLFALIETKKLGEIDQASRKQLEEYSLKLNHPISILTDGKTWEFYLNSLPSPTYQYQDRMINTINLLCDNNDDIVTLFTSLLHSNITPAVATALGKKMKAEFFIIQCIKSIKQQVINEHPNDVPAQLHSAFKSINAMYGKKVVKFEDVSRYWNTDIALGGAKDGHDDPGKGLGFTK